MVLLTSKETLVDSSSISPQEDPLFKRCKPVVYCGGKAPWGQIRKDVLEIERVQFGEKAYDEETFIKALSNPRCVFAVLRDRGNRRIVAFSYALPAEESYGADFHPERLEEIKPLGAKVAYIEDTAVSPKYTGHGLVGLLMSSLEKELVKRGFGYLDRDAALANNYASNIARTYGDRILMSYPHDSKYGPQVFFRIRLA